MAELIARERGELERANASGARPVVFVHGLWLLAESWDPWRRLFEERGYVALAPSWPGDPATLEEARLHPEAFANKRVQQATDHFADVLEELRLTPAVIGHSFGGLIAQKLAGMGLSAATVAIDPAPFRGVLPLPLATIKAAFPVLKNPANYGRAVAFTFEEFRYAFANAVSEQEARELYQAHAVAAPGAAVFQTASANINPGTEATVDTLNPERGPLLIISGEEDHLVPRAVAHAAFKRQQRNPGVTQFIGMPGRGHSLTLDSGWREVAQIALGFAMDHAPALGATPRQPIPLHPEV